MPHQRINHELVLKGRVLALRYTISLLLMRMDRDQRLPYDTELDNLDWLISRIRKSLSDLRRQRCPKHTEGNQ